MDALRKERHTRTEWEREREEERRRGREEREKTEFQRRMNPKTKEDFELLYHALEGEDSLISRSCCRVKIIQQFCPSFFLSLSPPPPSLASRGTGSYQLHHQWGREEGRAVCSAGAGGSTDSRHRSAQTGGRQEGPAELSAEISGRCK